MTNNTNRIGESDVWEYFSPPLVDDGMTNEQFETLLVDVWDRAWEMGREEGFEDGEAAGFDKGQDDGEAFARQDIAENFGSEEDLSAVRDMLSRLLNGESVRDVTDMLPASFLIKLGMVLR